ncbi:hypothetical protein D5018_14385 [Parashewanella curva]|uniref:Uncharacterized protein n=1 Tax=Parashewanella curva TaxID=2338552 RepID=A0A3L8PWL8_9GAMM|nr:hypothetical protein [Parashewanella curva]RLV59013.1 hypothetical protein D5018_14385 [Parashewanella curva]
MTIEMSQNAILQYIIWDNLESNDTDQNDCRTYRRPQSQIPVIWYSPSDNKYTINKIKENQQRFVKFLSRYDISKMTQDEMRSYLECASDKVEKGAVDDSKVYKQTTNHGRIITLGYFSGRNSLYYISSRQ